ncbi:hypothetical protein L7F22_065468 [Adiantum nelumboides]|nr:hypothetical protein [Adiantum nelumboides]
MPYTAQQNGVVERKNRSLMEMARCMLKANSLPHKLWMEAVRWAAHVLNGCPTRALKTITPYEAWYDRKPLVSYLHVFGCLAYARIPQQLRGKPDIRQSNVYLWGTIVEVKTQDVFESLLPSFVENQESQQVDNLDQSFDQLVTPHDVEEIVHEEQEILREERTLPKWVQKTLQDSKLDAPLPRKTHVGPTFGREQVDLACFSTLCEADEPDSFEQALESLVAIAAHHGWKVHQLDIKIAFLNGYLQEEVYVSQPSGFVVKGQEQKEEERLIDFGSLDLQNDVASPDATWAIDFLAHKLQETMANPTLQVVVHTQLQRKAPSRSCSKENLPSKSKHEASKRGNSFEQKKNSATTRRGQSPPHEAKARKKTKDTTNRSPGYDVDTLATSDPDVLPRRRIRAPSSSPPDGRRSSSSHSYCQSEESEKKGEKKQRKKKPSSSPPSQSSFDLGSSSSLDANSRKSCKYRGH